MKKFALVSVFDKTNISDLAKILTNSGYTIISTGGTYKELKDNGIEVTPIEEITGNPKDSFDGRMKTISFQIESGILFDRKNPEHIKQAEELNIPQIDVVVCNLYPFEEESLNDSPSKPIIEYIDVGGPTMIRAAAKNYQNVVVIVDSGDYEKVSEALRDEKLRKELASKAFYHLSVYDSQIGNYFSNEKFPKEVTIPLRKVNDLRYGENPHQQGAFYTIPNTNSPLAKLQKLWGRDLSGTNIGDIYSGIETVRQFRESAACVIKHLSPCGIGVGKDAEEALKRAVEADPVSAFGGVIVINKEMDLETAKIVAKFKNEMEGNIDIVAVPSVTVEALGLLKSIRKSMGIYIFGEIPANRSENWDLKYFAGAVLLQDFDDNVEDSFKDWKVVTDKQPTKEQLELAEFGFKAVKSVKSNSVLVVDKNIPMTRGIGSGQTSRVGACKIALEQAEKLAEGGVLVSDSFFPFDDCVRLAAEYKIAFIVQQGGSINDKLSIEAANKSGIPMILTGRRAFRH